MPALTELRSTKDWGDHSPVLLNIINGLDTDGIAKDVEQMKEFKPTDAYVYFTDNRPLYQLLRNDLILMTDIAGIFSEILDARGNTSSLAERLENAISPDGDLIIDLSAITLDDDTVNSNAAIRESGQYTDAKAPGLDGAYDGIESGKETWGVKLSLDVPSAWLGYNYLNNIKEGKGFSGVISGPDVKEFIVWEDFSAIEIPETTYRIFGMEVTMPKSLAVIAADPYIDDTSGRYDSNWMYKAINPITNPSIESLVHPTSGTTEISAFKVYRTSNPDPLTSVPFADRWDGFAHGPGSSSIDKPIINYLKNMSGLQSALQIKNVGQYNILVLQVRADIITADISSPSNPNLNPGFNVGTNAGLPSTHPIYANFKPYYDLLTSANPYDVLRSRMGRDPFIMPMFTHTSGLPRMLTGAFAYLQWEYALYPYDPPSSAPSPDPFDSSFMRHAIAENWGKRFIIDKSTGKFTEITGDILDVHLENYAIDPGLWLYATGANASMDLLLQGEDPYGILDSGSSIQNFVLAIPIAFINRRGYAKWISQENNSTNREVSGAGSWRPDHKTTNISADDVVDLRNIVIDQEVDYEYIMQKEFHALLRRENRSMPSFATTSIALHSSPLIGESGKTQQCYAKISISPTLGVPGSVWGYPGSLPTPGISKKGFQEAGLIATGAISSSGFYISPAISDPGAIIKTNSLRRSWSDRSIKQKTTLLFCYRTPPSSVPSVNVNVISGASVSGSSDFAATMTWDQASPYGRLDVQFSPSSGYPLLVGDPSSIEVKNGLMVNKCIRSSGGEDISVFNNEYTISGLSDTTYPGEYAGFTIEFNTDLTTFLPAVGDTVVLDLNKIYDAFGNPMTGNPMDVVGTSSLPIYNSTTGIAKIPLSSDWVDKINNYMGADSILSVPVVVSFVIQYADGFGFWNPMESENAIYKISTDMYGGVPNQLAYMQDNLILGGFSNNENGLAYLEHYISDGFSITDDDPSGNNNRLTDLTPRNNGLKGVFSASSNQYINRWEPFVDSSSTEGTYWGLVDSAGYVYVDMPMGGTSIILTDSVIFNHQFISSESPDYKKYMRITAVLDIIDPDNSGTYATRTALSSNPIERDNDGNFTVNFTNSFDRVRLKCAVSGMHYLTSSKYNGILDSAINTGVNITAGSDIANHPSINPTTAPLTSILDAYSLESEGMVMLWGYPLGIVGCGTSATTSLMLTSAARNVLDISVDASEMRHLQPCGIIKGLYQYLTSNSTDEKYYMAFSTSSAGEKAQTPFILLSGREEAYLSASFPIDKFAGTPSDATGFTTSISSVVIPMTIAMPPIEGWSIDVAYKTLDYKDSTWMPYPNAGTVAYEIMNPGYICDITDGAVSNAGNTYSPVSEAFPRIAVPALHPLTTVAFENILIGPDPLTDPPIFSRTKSEDFSHFKIIPFSGTVLGSSLIVDAIDGSAIQDFTDSHIWFNIESSEFWNALHVWICLVRNSLNELYLLAYVRSSNLGATTDDQHMRIFQPANSLFDPAIFARLKTLTHRYIVSGSTLGDVLERRRQLLKKNV